MSDLGAGLGPLGDEVLDWDTAADADLRRASGPDLLAVAADLLPSVVGKGPVLTVDLHAALCEAVGVLGLGRDRWHRLRFADQASDLFAAYLVVGGHADPIRCAGDTLRGWLGRQDLLMVRLALAAASGHWRRELNGSHRQPVTDRNGR